MSRIPTMFLIPTLASRLVLGLLLLVAPPAATAQQGDTDILLGTVVDTTNAAVAGVTVSVTHLATGSAIDVVTDSRGQYRTPPLRIGEHETRAELSGFTPVPPAQAGSAGAGRSSRTADPETDAAGVGADGTAAGVGDRSVHREAAACAIGATHSLLTSKAWAMPANVTHGRRKRSNRRASAPAP